MRRRAAVLVVLVGIACSSRAAAQTLDAPEDVREVTHDVRVTFTQGVAEIAVRIELARDGTQRAEVGYVLPLARGAQAISLEVCRPGGGCRALSSAIASGGRPVDPYAIALHGVPRGRTSRPIARASWRPSGVTMRAAPVGGAARLVLTVRYAAPLAVRGGVSSLVLPARDADARLAPSSITLVAPDHDTLSVSGGAPGEDATISARIASPLRVLADVECVGARCAHAHLVEPRRIERHDVILAIDASPSMLDVPTERVEATLRALLAALPDGSRVRVMRFAARARWDDDTWRSPATLDAAHLASEAPGALGSRTTFDAALALSALDDATAPLVVVVGDGWLDGADLVALESRGARVVIANVSDAPFGGVTLRAASATTSTMTLALGASFAGNGIDLASIVAEPTSRARLELRGEPAIDLPSVPSGEPLSLVTTGRASRLVVGARAVRASTPSDALHAVLAPQGSFDALALDRRVLGDVDKWMRPRRPPLVPGGIGGVQSWITAMPIGHGLYARCARPPRIRIPPPARIRATASAETLRRMVRVQLAPRVRGCLAAARAGRPDWHAHVTLHLSLAHREVLAARASGENVDATLESCILAGVDDLQVPRFDGRIDVGYPFRAVAIARPDVLPLDPETSSLVDALLTP
ncbi:hypothetical protein [Sandaracinus amylolyticus]|uniref:hypothetical protein n=1 Tax=Sandaracinus amylolyticus TaxID=927083 RepID=UPI001F48656D|nr:hypothetical protein [Sandaracinus amylolyticus]UJR85789.1 Hypothetical protein I5071_78690 [Sandaracinus amylolyticus]